MSAFSTQRVSPAQLDQLVSDPELLSATGTVSAAIATRASQASVDNIGATLGPAIVDATADKATAAKLAETQTALATAVSAVNAALTALLVPKAATSDVAAARDVVLAALGTTNAAVTGVVAESGAAAGEVKLISNVSGLAPAGYIRGSGLMVPSSVYEQHRILLTNGIPDVTCNNSTTHYRVSLYGTARSYTPATGVAASIASPANYSGYAASIVADNEFLYAFGGGAGAGVAAGYKMALSAGSWASIAAVPAALHDSTVGMFADGSPVIVGGSPSAGFAYNVLTTALFKYNAATNTYTTGVMPAATARGRSLLLRFGAYAGYVFAYFPAGNCANAGQTAISAVPRAFLISPALVVTEVDACYGAAAYELPTGQVVALLPTLSSSALHDFTLPPGLQSRAYPLTAPTGFSPVFLPGRDYVMADKFMPLAHGTVAAQFYTGAPANLGTTTFYATKL